MPSPSVEFNIIPVDNPGSFIDSGLYVDSPFAFIDKPDISVLEMGRMPGTKVGAGDEDGWIVWPPDAWSTDQTDHPIVDEITGALRARRYDGSGNYFEVPYYYHQRELEFTVIYVMGERSSDYFLHPDFDAEEVSLNGPTNVKEKCARDYFISQSYGRFVPHFNIHREVFTFDEDECKHIVWNPINCVPEIADTIGKPENRLSGSVLRPVIMFVNPGNPHGAIYYNNAYILEEQKGEDGKDEYSFFGLVHNGFYENWSELIPERGFPISTWFWSIGSIPHEIGHVLSWPDTYHDLDGLDKYHTRELDLMGSTGFTPLGVHKVMSGWTCFIYTKYDTNGLAIKPQDTYEGRRELYFIYHKPDDAAE
ncbi:hypothetical protein J7J84_07675, partial [bacterium]|nr:hypothetical protein [bacterium]